jgi:hypothetical protein
VIHVSSEIQNNLRYDVRNTKLGWFVDCGYGLFTHYLADNRHISVNNSYDWNVLVDGFNVTKLANQLYEAKICYHFITLGQNSGETNY